MKRIKCNKNVKIDFTSNTFLLRNYDKMYGKRSARAQQSLDAKHAQSMQLCDTTLTKILDLSCFRFRRKKRFFEINFFPKNEMLKK
jgi:hypothetical protein